MRNRHVFAVLLCLGIAALSASADSPSERELLLDQPLEPCDYDLEEVAARSGAFYTNFWPNGVVPYRFVTGTNDSIPVNGNNGWTRILSDVTFSIPFTGPQLSSPTGFPLTWSMFDIIRVQGSQRNDNLDLKIVGGTLNSTGTALATVRVEQPIGQTFSAESPSPNVKFFITLGVSEENQARFEEGIARWEAVSDLDFRPYQSGDAGWIEVYNFNINSVRGNVGYGTGDRDLALTNWGNRRTITHELGHALGLKHEHQRPDRNAYVSVDTSKSTPRGDNNYAIDNTITVYPNLTYDFGSIMHYAQNDFLASGQTGPVITVLDAGDAAIWQTVMGTIDSLSVWDKKTMSFMYPRPNWGFVRKQSTDPTADGDFLTPWKSLGAGVSGVPSGGRLFITHPGDYVEPGLYSKPMLIEAPQGGVTISAN